MSDEEHQFESKADAGASKTYPQQAGTICKDGYIVIKGRACKEEMVKAKLEVVEHGRPAVEMTSQKESDHVGVVNIVPKPHLCHLDRFAVTLQNTIAIFQRVYTMDTYAVMDSSFFKIACNAAEKKNRHTLELMVRDSRI
ncbi:Eukaryotic translation initiation factor 5A [Heracleum sosnowskyi]|uniref:Eukaryotic translation initiation factor 5A n=1 Tax=Heracleum sosnowskyi TaxID=360622 RepID=A0AAD8M8E5_9APIA|nr:Eukaryotic translation initiation factor 5A [Heracleum sosnowskyi]